ncbi:MAG: TetR family transcriptional regulator [Lachnospiraceae bacterium]|nr:TetR family transcriptional regulator [Lachnospiraceae bacterium]
MLFDNFLLGNGTLQGIDEMRVRGCAYGEFAEKGFLSASLKNIAAKAEVSEKQLLTAFGSKEELLERLIEELIENATSKETNSSLEMLASIVDSMKHEIELDTRKASFIGMLFYDQTIPADVKQTCVECFENTRAYECFARDCGKGLIKCDDSADSLVNFFQAVFNIVKGYAVAGVEPPATEWLLALLFKKIDDTKDNEDAIIKRQNSVIATFASDFDSILFVDLDTGKMDVYQANGANDQWIMDSAGKGYNEYRKNFAKTFLFPEDAEWFLKETEPQSIMNRFDEDPVLFIDHRVNYKGRTVFYQTIIALDPMYSYGNRILIGGHKIASAKRPRPVDDDFDRAVFG